MPEPLDGPVAAALERWAREQPEAPLLFYRNAKGHFRWWSFSTAFAWFEQGGLGDEKLSVKGVVVEREAEELLGGFLRSTIGEGGDVGDGGDSGDTGDSAGAAALPIPGPGAGRDVWISWRALSHPAELALARWAVVAGAAILVEPGACLHPELFAWARPTVMSGSAEELLRLAAQLESLAPRFLRRRWYRQRGERLRLLLVEEAPSPLELQEVTERWRALAPQATIAALSEAKRLDSVLA